MSVKANKDISRQLTKELWTNRKTDVIQKIIADKCVFRAGDREFRGPKGYREFYDTYVKAFPDLSIQINDLIGENDVVVTSYTARGQHSGPLMDIAPTGTQVEVDGISISRFEDGQIVHMQTLWNEMSLMQQLGVAPESTLRRGV